MPIRGANMFDYIDGQTDQNQIVRRFRAAPSFAASRSDYRVSMLFSKTRHKSIEFEFAEASVPFNCLVPHFMDIIDLVMKWLAGGGARFNTNKLFPFFFWKSQNSVSCRDFY